eukprot:1910430-Pleurochrysis_carterae.AAC.2
MPSVDTAAPEAQVTYASIKACKGSVLAISSEQAAEARCTWTFICFFTTLVKLLFSSGVVRERGAFSSIEHCSSSLIVDRTWPSSMISGKPTSMARAPSDGSSLAVLAWHTAQNPHPVALTVARMHANAR